MSIDSFFSPMSIDTVNSSHSNDILSTVFDAICDRLELEMLIFGKPLPDQWSIPDFSRAVIGEESVKDFSYLHEVLFDLSTHGSLVLGGSCKASNSNYQLGIERISLQTGSPPFL